MRTLILVVLVACLQLHAADSATNSIIYKWTVSGRVVSVHPKSIVVAVPKVVPLTARERAAMNMEVRDMKARAVTYSCDDPEYTQWVFSQARLLSSGKKTIFVQFIFVNVPYKYAVGDLFSGRVKPVTINGVTCYDCSP